MDQDETWHGGRPRSRHIALDGDAAPLPQSSTAPNFRSMSIMAKRSPISATAEHSLSTMICAVLHTYNKHYLSAPFLPWVVQKTAEPIKMSFEMCMDSGARPKKHVLDGVHIGAT